MFITQYNDLCKKWNQEKETLNQPLGQYLLDHTSPRIFDVDIFQQLDKSKAATLFFTRHVKTRR